MLFNVCLFSLFWFNLCSLWSGKEGALPITQIKFLLWSIQEEWFMKVLSSLKIFTTKGSFGFSLHWNSFFSSDCFETNPTRWPKVCADTHNSDVWAYQTQMSNPIKQFSNESKPEAGKLSSVRAAAQTTWQKDSYVMKCLCLVMCCCVQKHLKRRSLSPQGVEMCKLNSGFILV